MAGLIWLVKTCAGREHYLPYLKRHLPVGTVYCFDDTGNGVVGNTIKALRIIGEAPAVVMEDDILLTQHFEEKARAAIADKPDNLIQFFSMRKADLTVGSRWEPGRSYLMNQCHYVPPGMAAPMADYMADRVHARARERGGSDSLMRDYLASNKLVYWVHVPSLVDHRVGKSAINPKRASTNRQSFTFRDPIPDKPVVKATPKAI